MKNKDVTILVNSCDKYEDAWEPFFRLLKIQWPDCPYDIVLSTETKTYECDFFNVKTINCDKTLSWSSRLKYTLSQIDTDYVLFFLEDFFLLEKVQTDIFNLALELIKSNKEIGLITFNKRRYGASFPEQPDYAKCFIELDKTVLNRTNVLVGLWKKSCYEKLVFDNEDPWQYEKNSNIRSRYAGFKVYTQNYEVSHPAFRYCMNPADGYGITCGKWLNKNREFFEANGILNVNYDNLGVFEQTITYEGIQNENTLKKEHANQIKKAILKDQKLFFRIKEFLFNIKKGIKKSFIWIKFKHIKTCFGYYCYYRKNN